MIMLIDVTERILLQDKLRQLATMDSLTGICNRTYFLELSEAYLTEAADNRNPLSIILLDVDFFKSINDRYGHQYGDQALQHLANVTNRHLREGDLFGRYGGEEFVICLPDTALQQAALLCEKIRTDIEASILYTLIGPIQITASFGVVEALRPEATLEELLSEADHALYSAKRNGRNAVHLSQQAKTSLFTPML